MLAAKPDHLTVDQHHFDAEDVVCGKPILKAMHPAGILRDIASDRAGDLPRRIRSVIEAGMLDRFGDRELRTPGRTPRHRRAQTASSARCNLAMPRTTPSANGYAGAGSQ